MTKLDGLTVMGWLMKINLGLALLQPLSAGFFLSGYGRAATVHAVVAHALQLGALVQGIIGVVLWRRHRIPARVAGASIGLFAMLFLQVGLGYRKVYWLHVPIGVGMISWLMRQASALDTLRHASGAESARHTIDASFDPALERTNRDVVSVRIP